MLPHNTGGDTDFPEFGFVRISAKKFLPDLPDGVPLGWGEGFSVVPRFVSGFLDGPEPVGNGVDGNRIRFEVRFGKKQSLHSFGNAAKWNEIDPDPPTGLARKSHQNGGVGMRNGKLPSNRPVPVEQNGPNTLSA